MKLKTMVVSLMTLGFSSPLLAAIQPYYMDTSYQLDVMRDQMSKLDVIFNQINPVVLVSLVAGLAVSTSVAG